MTYTGTYISSTEIGAGQNLTARVQGLQDKIVEGFDKVVEAIHDLRGTASEPTPHTATLADIVDALTATPGAVGDCSDPCGVMFCMYATLQAIEALLSSGLVVNSTINVDNDDVVSKLTDIHTRLATTNSTLTNISTAMPSGYATSALQTTQQEKLELIRANIAAGNTSMHGYLTYDGKGLALLLNNLSTVVDLSHIVLSNLQKILSFDSMTTSYEGSMLGVLAAAKSEISNTYLLLGPQAGAGTVRGDLDGLQFTNTQIVDRLTWGPDGEELASIAKNQENLLTEIRDAIESCCEEDVEEPLLPTEPEEDTQVPVSNLCQRAQWAVAVIVAKLAEVQTYTDADGGISTASFTLDALRRIVNVPRPPRHGTPGVPGLGLSTTELTNLYFDILFAAEHVRGLDGISSDWVTNAAYSWNPWGGHVQCAILTAAGPSAAKSAINAMLDSYSPVIPTGYATVWRAFISNTLLNIIYSDTFPYDVDRFDDDCSGCENVELDPDLVASEYVDLCQRSVWFIYFALEGKIGTIRSYEVLREDGFYILEPSFTIGTLTAIVNTAQPGLYMTASALDELYHELTYPFDESVANLLTIESQWSQDVLCAMLSASGPTAARSSIHAVLDDTDFTQREISILKAFFTTGILNLIYSDEFPHDVSGMSTALCDNCSSSDCSDVVTLTSENVWYDMGDYTSTIVWDLPGADPRLSAGAANYIGTVWHTYVDATEQVAANTVANPANQTYYVKEVYGSNANTAIHVYRYRPDGSYEDTPLVPGEFSAIDYGAEFDKIVVSLNYVPGNPHTNEFQIEWCFNPPDVPPR